MERGEREEGGEKKRRGIGLGEEAGEKRKEDKDQKEMKEAEEGRAGEKVREADFGGRRWEVKLLEEEKGRRSEGGKGEEGRR